MLDRFAAPGQRAVAAAEYRPTTPRKTEYLIEKSPPEPVAQLEPEPVAEPVQDDLTEPEPVAVVEPELEPEPEPVAVEEPEPEPEPVIDLVSAEEPSVLSEALAGPEISDSGDSEPVGANGHVDKVLQALIGRVASTDADVAEVAADLIERAHLDADEMAEVLTDLVERVEADHGIALGDRSEELTLFSEQVPRRPGQITDFAELGDRERRRVIIRVLCLLVARSEDGKRDLEEATPETEEGQWPLARAVWPSAEAEAEDDADLPARRNRLARLRR